MKKLVSLAMALVMMFALLIPAAAASETSAKKAKTIYGFFEDQGATGATKILTGCKYKSYIKKTTVDACYLTNVLKALDYIDEYNEYREKEGLDALKVTHENMARAIADCDYACSNLAHPQQFDGFENLKWGGSDPFATWYTEEKNNYKTKNGKETGHYENIVRKNIKFIGFGYSTRDYQGMKPIYCSFATTSKETKAYTVAKYRKALKTYMKAQGMSTSV